jgi:signal transduction histidine kinase
MDAELPEDEAGRLEALYSYHILDTLPEQTYDDIAHLASEICGTPIALISLVDHNRQWFKSRVGLDVQETPRSMSICSHALLRPNDLLIVPDAREDVRFADLPPVQQEPHVRFYAGAPLVTSQGHALGTLCVVDMAPRGLTVQQEEALRALARQVMGQLELRQKIEQLERVTDERERAEETLRRLNDELEERVARRTAALKGAKEEAEASREEAERANKAKSEFLSRMSHELRTPLNAILGFAQVLEMKATQESEQEAVGYILRAGQHLLGMINEVLALSRIESGRIPVSIGPVELEPLISEVLDLIAPLASQHGIHVRHAVHAAERALILADRQLLMQVLLNLLANAVKYTPQGGNVLLECSALGEDRVQVAVRDDGPGMERHILARAFVPFERLGAEHSGVEGTGLGLALCKGMVEAMQGEIGLESELGTGTTAWVQLPRTPDRVVNSPSAPGEAGDSVGGHADRDVLLIEDNLANLSLIEHIFADQPQIHLLPATDGPSGLEMARRHHPSLILLDLHLPGMSGEDVLRRLHERPETADIPVVVVSADVTHSQIKRLEREGAAAHLAKPLNVAQFLNTVATFLN